MADLDAELSEGESSDSEALNFSLEAYDENDVYVRPDDGQVVVEQHPDDEHVLDVTGFDRWEVLAVDKDFVHLDLKEGPNSSTGVELECYSTGLVRFLNPTTDVSWAEDAPPDQDVTEYPHLVELSSDNWWAAATDNWTLTSGDLDVPSGEDFTLFYHTKGRERRVARLLYYPRDALRLGDANIERFARAARAAIWADVERDLDILENQVTPQDKTDGFLQNYGRQLFLVEKRSDESDASYRIRVQGEANAREGRTTPDEILELVETLLDADEGDVTITENEDPSTGDYRPARFHVTFSQGLLEDLGFEAPFTQILNDIDTILQRVSAAGVLGETQFQTSATWDDGDTYDSAEVWGT